MRLAPTFAEIRLVLIGLIAPALVSAAAPPAVSEPLMAAELPPEVTAVPSPRLPLPLRRPPPLPRPRPTGIKAYLERGLKHVETRAVVAPGLPGCEVAVLEEGDSASRHRTVVIVRVGARHHEVADVPFGRLDRIADIDRDGWPELILEVRTGDTCTACRWVEAVTVTPEGPRVLVGPRRFRTLVDLDGDGRAEALAVDDRWEHYQDLSRSASPDVDRVWRLDGGTWVRDDLRHAQHHRDALAKIEADLEAAVGGAPTGWDDEVVGLELSALLRGLFAGDATGAWTRFRARITARRDALEPAEDEARAKFDALLTAVQRDLKL